MRNYIDFQSMAEPASPHYGSNRADPYVLSIADKIRSMKSRYASDYRRSLASQKNSRGASRTPAIKDSNAKDMSNILQKNMHISTPADKLDKSAKTSKIRHNLKNMKKLDLQEVLNYAPGTAVYFGATIAFQSRHGGFLSFNHASDIKASAHKILPSARFVVWNCDDLSDHGIVRYGDAVWLQAGAHEVLGAQYGGKAISSDGIRKIHPALINCRRENFFKAQQYGRWIVLNRQDPTGMLGEQVLHQDHIMLEQEWCFLASHTPYDAFMEKYNSFEDAEKSNSNSADFFHPTDECKWKLHLVTLPSDDNPDARFREYLLEQAKDQIKLSSQDRRKKESVLSVSLSRSLPTHLRSEEVVARHLPQLQSQESKQLHLLAKFDKQMLRNFRADGPDVTFLRNLYGSDSIVYKNAKADAVAIAEEIRANMAKQQGSFIADETDKGNAANSGSNSLLEAEEAYWDVANCILMNTKSWEHLPSSMVKYQEISHDKKEVAARVIQRFLREKMEYVFAWKRSFRRIDNDGMKKLRNSYHPVTVTYKKSVSKKPMDKPPLHSLQSQQSNLEVGLRERQESQTVFVTEVPRKNSIPRTMSRPGSAPNLKMESIRDLKRKSKSLMGIDDRPTTAPHPQGDSDGGGADASHTLERTSSMSALLTARKMMFAEAQSSSYSESKGRSKHSGSVSRQNSTAPVILEEPPPRKSGENNKISPQNSTENSKKDKLRRKKKRFEEIMNSLEKTKERDFGLPRDVFRGQHDNVSVKTCVSFLRASSSNPHIYSDIKTKKRK